MIVSLAVLVIAAGGCGSSGGGSDPTGATGPSIDTHRPHAVVTEERTYVDASRTTQANGSAPESATRTLVTTVLVPQGEGAPFPLVVLAHGFGGNRETLEPMATEWARAGYMVAIPAFPLTNFASPGGVNGSDIDNQPGDVSFVIDSVLADPAYSGIADGDAIALAGHSNGGITTLATIANSCCRDRRIGAAIVFAGVTSPIGGGTYDLTDIPPTLWVHGTDDSMIDVDQASRNFNDAASPKGMLRIEGGSHVSLLVPGSPEFATVAAATIDFLDAELRGDPAALDALPSDGLDGVATMYWSGDDSDGVTAPTVPRTATERTATISARDGLVAGQTVTVTWSGFLPGKTINIVQCASDGRGGSGSCEIVPGRVLIPNPTGSGTMDITITVGTVGNGICDADNPCTLLINDAGLQDPDAFIYFPLTFAR